MDDLLERAQRGAQPGKIIAADGEKTEFDERLENQATPVDC